MRGIMNKIIKDMVWITYSREQIPDSPKDEGMSNTIKFEKSSGNVFLDIGFSKEEAEREVLRTDLAFEVYNLLEERKLSSAKAGELLGLSPSEVDHIKNGDFEHFSIEHLFTLLNRLNRNVEIRITPSESTGGHQRVVTI